MELWSCTNRKKNIVLYIIKFVHREFHLEEMTQQECNNLSNLTCFTKFSLNVLINYMSATFQYLYMELFIPCESITQCQYWVIYMGYYNIQENVLHISKLIKKNKNWHDHLINHIFKQWTVWQARDKLSTSEKHDYNVQRQYIVLWNRYCFCFLSWRGICVTHPLRKTESIKSYQRPPWGLATIKQQSSWHQRTKQYHCAPIKAHLDEDLRPHAGAKSFHICDIFAEFSNKFSAEHHSVSFRTSFL